MAEEQQQEEVKEPEYTEVEQEAIDAGWNPDYKGDKFVDAKEYLDRAPLFRRIKSTQKELEEMKAAMHDLTAHHKLTEQKSYERARVEFEQQLNQLNAAKVQALDEGDNKRAVQIDNAIRASQPPPPPVDNTNYQTMMVNQWRNENPWYGTDESMTLVADGIFAKYSANLPINELLSKMKEKAESATPKTERPERQQGVEGVSQGGGGRKRNPTEKDLDADEREVFNRMSKFLPKEERSQYIKEIINNR